MPQQIQAPDGSIVEFPDGMSDDQMAAAMQAEYGGPKKTSQALGFVEGVRQVANNLEPMTSAAPHMRLMSMARKPAEDAIDRGIERLHDAGVTPGRAGKVVGGLVASAPTMFMGGPMTSGAIQGYATSDADNLQGKLMDAGVGALGGKIGGFVMDKAADVVAPVIRPAVQKLTDAGLPLTPGQIKGGKTMIREDKAMSLPGIGDAIRADRASGVDQWNRATLERLALEPLGIKLPADVATGHDAILFAQQALSDAYDKIIPKMAVAPDRRFVAGLSKAGPAIQALPEQQLAQFNRIMENIRFGEGGRLAGQQLKNAQGELGRLASTYNSSAAAGERELGRVLGVVRDQLNDLMARQNPDLAPVLQQTNKGYRGLAIVENAAKGADGGVFNTGQLKTAVRQGDKSTRKRNTAAGQAHGQDWVEASRAVLPAVTPDSGTAGRMMTGLMPQIIGRTAEVGYNAAKVLTKAELAKRPELAKKIAEVMRALKAPAGGLSAAGLLQLTNQ